MYLTHRGLKDISKYEMVISYSLNNKTYGIGNYIKKGVIRGLLHNHQTYLFKTTARAIGRI
jgi:hypothetical protein